MSKNEYKIIDIRGTNGSGKTTLVKRLLGENYAALVGPAYGAEPGKMWAAEAVAPDGNPMYAIGQYSPDVPSGGCDTVPTQDMICDRIRELSKWGHVVFEGLLTSGLHSRYRDLAMELGTDRYIVYRLDTDIDTCLDRVGDRREAKGRPRDGFKVELVTGKHRAIDSACRKLEDDGIRVVVGPPQPNLIRELLNGFGQGELPL